MKLNTKPLKDIEFGFPVLAAGTYIGKCVGKEVKPNKAGTGNNLVLEFKICDSELIKHDGTKIENKGNIQLTSYIGLVPTDKYDPNSRIKELAVASGRDKDSEDDFDVADIAEYMLLKVSYKKAEGQYQEGNSIDGYKPVPADFTQPAF